MAYMIPISDLYDTLQRKQRFSILSNNSLGDIVQAALPQYMAMEQYKGWSEDAVFTDVLHQMEFAGVRAIGAQFEYLTTLVGKPTDPVWGQYTYEEILNMADEGVVIPDDILQWAKAEANADTMNYQIDDDATTDDSVLTEMNSDLSDDKTVAAKQAAQKYSMIGDSQSELTKDKALDVENDNIKLTEKQNTLESEQQAAANKVEAYSKELVDLEQKVSNGETLSTREQMRYQALAGKINEENREIVAKTNNMQAEVESLFKSIDEVETLVDINEKLAEKMETENQTFVEQEAKSNSGTLPTVNKYTGLVNSMYLNRALSGVIFDGVNDISNSILLQTSTLLTNYSNSISIKFEIENDAENTENINILEQKSIDNIDLNSNKDDEQDINSDLENSGDNTVNEDTPNETVPEQPPMENDTQIPTEPETDVTPNETVPEQPPMENDAQIPTEPETDVTPNETVPEQPPMENDTQNPTEPETDVTPDATENPPTTLKTEQKNESIENILRPKFGFAPKLAQIKEMLNSKMDNFSGFNLDKTSLLEKSVSQISGAAGLSSANNSSRAAKDTISVGTSSNYAASSQGNTTTGSNDNMSETDAKNVEAKGNTAQTTSNNAQTRSQQAESDKANNNSNINTHTASLKKNEAKIKSLTNENKSIQSEVKEINARAAQIVASSEELSANSENTESADMEAKQAENNEELEQITDDSEELNNEVDKNDKDITKLQKNSTKDSQEVIKNADADESVDSAELAETEQNAQEHVSLSETIVQIGDKFTLTKRVGQALMLSPWTYSAGLTMATIGKYGEQASFVANSLVQIAHGNLITTALDIGKVLVGLEDMKARSSSSSKSVDSAANKGEQSVSMAENELAQTDTYIEQADNAPDAENDATTGSGDDKEVIFEDEKSESEETPDIQQKSMQKLSVSSKDIELDASDTEDIRDNSEQVQNVAAQKITSERADYLKNPLISDKSEQQSEELTIDIDAKVAQAAAQESAKESAQKTVKESVREVMQSTLSSVNQKAQNKDTDKDKRHKMFTQFEREKQEAIRKAVQKISNVKDAR